MFNFNKFKKNIFITNSLLILSFTHSILFAQQAPTYNYDQHFYKNDVNTGYNIGASLYALKNTEMQAIIKSVIDEVNSMTEKDRLKFANKNGLNFNISTDDFSPAIDIKKVIKEFKVEKAVEERNLKLIQKMNSLPLPQLSEAQKLTRVASISDNQLIDTSISINYSPASDHVKELKDKYDPKGNYGLCFLRAHYYANEAGQRGLVKESIKKVFVVGTMMPLGTIEIGVWQFHVATALRGNSGEWKVLDNHLQKYQEKAYSVSDWYNFYNKWLDTAVEYKVENSSGEIETIKVKSLFLYFTDPAKIGASSNAYNKEAFYGVDINKNGQLEENEKFYNSVFLDVDKHLATSRPSVCDPDRYQPLNSEEARCNSIRSKKRIAQRTELIHFWKLQWLNHFSKEVDNSELYR